MYIIGMRMFFYGILVDNERANAGRVRRYPQK